MIKPHVGIMIEPHVGIMIEPHAGIMIEPQVGIMVEPPDAGSIARSLDRSVARSLDRSLLLGSQSFCPRQDQESPNSFMDGALGTRHAWGWLETRALAILTRANSRSFFKFGLSAFKQV